MLWGFLVASGTGPVCSQCATECIFEKLGGSVFPTSWETLTRLGRAVRGESVTGVSPGCVVEGDLAAVEAYKSSGGDIARQLTADEVQLLNRSSAFDVGFTLVHLSIRFQRQDMLAILLTEVNQQAAKCIPSMVCPELTEQIRREIAASLHQRKGDFACYFLTDLVTFTLPA
ncbi:Ubiquitin thioesterase Zranb1, partial [Characodon lateralis]|nr:Ubiquitin thioesterase Zranb1 [Characodon lateralis]